MHHACRNCIDQTLLGERSMKRKISIVLIFLTVSALFAIALRAERHSRPLDTTTDSTGASHVAPFAFAPSLFGPGQEEVALLLAGGIFFVLSLFPRKKMSQTRRALAASSEPHAASVEAAQSPRLS
jgi:hypothetical protein